MALWQYLSFLIAGVWYYMLLAAFASAGAGVGLLGIVLIFLAIALGGYASGLSLVAPRLAAGIGGIASLVFLLYSTMLVLSEAGGPGEFWITLPALGAVVFSAIALRSGRTPMWTRQDTSASKVILGFLMLLPALPASYVLLYITTNLFGSS